MPISRANGENLNFSKKTRWNSTLSDGKFSNLEKSENFLPKFDYLEYLRLRKIFWEIGNFPIFQLFRKLRWSWDLKRLDTSAPTPNPFEKKNGKKNRHFWWTYLGNVPPFGDPPGVKIFPRHVLRNMSAKYTPLGGTSLPWNIFPRHAHWTCLGKVPALALIVRELIRLIIFRLFFRLSPKLNLFAMVIF